MRGSSTFKFDKNQTEFIIPIQNKFKWWYLLPLLLLILLIKINSFVDYKVIDADSKIPITNAQIILTSQYYNLNTNTVTDTAGYAKFFIGKYPIYKILFSSELKQNILTTVSNEFYSSASFEEILKKLASKLNIVELKNTPPSHITIIDSINRKPIQGINVIATFPDSSETRISDVNGNVDFSYFKLKENDEIIVSAESPDYEDVRRYYTINLPKTINDTIALLSIADGGLKGLRGDITVNLAWNTTDDLDLMIIDPCNNQVYYKNRHQTCSDGKGFLDLDANANEDSLTTAPQENIYWENPSVGAYKVMVYFYKKRNNQSVPFKITMILKNKRKVIDSLIINQKDYYFIDTIVIR